MAEDNIVKIPAGYTSKLMAHRPRAEVCRVRADSRPDGAKDWEFGFFVDIADKNQIAQPYHLDLAPFKHISLTSVEARLQAYVRTSSGEWPMVMDRINKPGYVLFNCYSGPGQTLDDPHLQLWVHLTKV